MLKVDTIVSVCCIVLGVVFFALVAVWTPFCLFASVLFLIGIAIPTYNMFVDYLTYNKAIKEQRFVDAYLYADEQRDPNQIKDFKYDKKTERNLKMTKYNHFSSLFSLVVLLILAVILVIVSINIIFF